MISENGVPKNPGFFTLRSGSQKWVLNFVSFRLEIFLTDSLRSRICFFLGGSFLVPVRSYLTVTDLQSARVALLEAHSSSTFPSLRFWSSYHPLRYCESLFASRYASFFFPAPYGFALRANLDSSRPTRGRNNLDVRSIHFLNSRGDQKHCAHHRCSLLVHFFSSPSCLSRS